MKTFLLASLVCASALAAAPKEFSNASYAAQARASARRLAFAEVRVSENFEKRPSAAFPSAAFETGIVSPGLLVKTDLGLLAPGTKFAFPKSACAMPAAKDEWIAFGVRLYGFRGGAGAVEWKFAGGAGSLAFGVSSCTNGGFVLELREAGKTLARLPLAVGALPADVMFAANRAGEAEISASSLSESTIRRVAAATRLFASGEFGAEFFAVGATAVVDEFKCGVAADELATDKVPFKIERAAEFDPVKAGWRRVFADEFDGERVDWGKWYVPAWYGLAATNRAFVKDGVLHVRCDWNEKRTALETCSMRTRESFPFGYYEARVRFTKNSGWWAAFWLYGVSNASPAVDGFEIDVFEDYYTRSDKPEGPHRGLLDHNLHVYLGRQLKSWNYQSFLPGSLDDFYVIGCKYTPFEISYYLDGKLMKSAETIGHSPYDTVTFDGFSHCFGKAPLHAIVSGQIMKPTNTWGKKDTTGFTFPEDYLVDWVRIYEFPDAPDARPRVAWTRKGNARANAKVGETLTFAADVAPAAKGASPIRAAYLFDNGYMLACRTEPPWKFEVPFTKEFYSRSRYMRPGRQKAIPPFGGFAHAFEIFAQDADGKVSGSGVEFKYPDFGESSPRGGKAQRVPGVVKLAQYDDGGEGVGFGTGSEAGAPRKPGVAANGCLGGGAGGEWLKYTVDVDVDGTYAATMKAEARDVRKGARAILYVDDEFAGEWNLPPTDLMSSKFGWRTWTIDVKLARGRHVLRFVRWDGVQPLSVEFAARGS